MVANKKSTVTNWDGCQQITLCNGETATYSMLHSGQSYTIFLHNSAENQKDTAVTVIWSNSQDAVNATIGDNTVSVSIQNTENSTINCWLGSVGMATNNESLTNKQLLADPKTHEFSRYRRYYARIILGNN
ncbi:hypothetical protein NIES4071_46000 [Calothrix sp. NIES-4071]|nr:hypothetical protein NIES4071_46000 [Calothrix sp. NIES-4071]BAZ58912.1 hypothetical protein NIES4105_45930 [Calothrix sp. NIES-4105]